MRHGRVRVAFLVDWLARGVKSRCGRRLQKGPVVRWQPSQFGGAGGRDSITHERDLRLALSLADMSDELSMPLFRSEDRAHTRKADGSPVTEAGTSIERARRDELAASVPKISPTARSSAASGLDTASG
jgi:hypothetical protein